MTTHSSRIHEQHAHEYLRIIISGKLSAHEATEALNLVDEADYGANWQAGTIHRAARTAADIATRDGHGLDPLVATDVNEVLVNNGDLDNDGMGHTWLQFISPQDTPPELNKARLPQLAHRITEDFFRLRHSEIYAGANSMTAPLADLCAQMDRDRQDLLEIYGRMTKLTTRTMHIVKGGAA